VEAPVLEMFKVASKALYFTPNAVIAYELVAPVALFPLTVALTVVNTPVLLDTKP
jgi:hypothetical protein